jgi:hypothetical protein
LRRRIALKQAGFSRHLETCTGHLASATGQSEQRAVTLEMIAK